MSADYPAGVIAVDLNDDGILDLATANVGDLDLQEPHGTTVSVLFGQSDGTFGDYRQFDVGREPIDIVAAYFDEDNVLDLAVTNGNLDSNVSILFGEIDGSGFWDVDSSITRPVGSSNDLVGIVAGDVNDDGKADIVVANADDNSIAWLLGNGDETFEDAESFPTGGGSSPQYLALGDVDGDGWLDVAFSEADSDTISVLYGRLSNNVWNGFNRDNDFDSEDIDVGVEPAGIVAHDFNGDGLLDVAVANQGTFENENLDDSSISVILAEDDGLGAFDGFDTPVEYDVEQLGGLIGPTRIQVEDMNLDGDADLIFTARETDEVGILFGNGDGTFGELIDIAAGDYAEFGLAVADFNDDDIPDIAATNWEDDDISVLYFVGLTAGTGRTELTEGFFDSGSVPDLAAVTSTGIRVLLNQGGAQFDDTDTDYYVDLDLPSGVDAEDITDIIAADVLGTGGHVDIIVTDSVGHKVWIFENNDSTGLDFDDGASAQGYDVGYWPQAVIAENFHDDHDGTLDGKFDLAVVNWYSETVTILWAQSGGGYDDTVADGKREDFTVRETMFGSITDAAADDFNDDGYIDLAVIGDDSYVWVMKNLSGDAFAEEGETDFYTYDISGTGTSIATGDFDNDDDPDLAITVGIATEQGVNDHVVNVLFGRGPWFDDEIDASKRQIFDVGNVPVSITVGRFDSDEIDDFAVANQGGDSVTIYFGVDGGNPSNALTILNVGNWPWSIVSADFDESDSADEIALTVYQDNAIRILLVS